MDKFCQASFGFESVTGGIAYQRKLGLDRENLRNTKRLLLSMGEFDPVSSFGADSWNPGSSREHSRTLFIGQSAHVADVLLPNKLDPEALVQARMYELASFKNWLGLV